MIESRERPLCQLLVEAGSNMNARNKAGQNAWMMAVDASDATIARMVMATPGATSPATMTGEAKDSHFVAMLFYESSMCLDISIGDILLGGLR
jgi:hypothetical protein